MIITEKKETPKKNKYFAELEKLEENSNKKRITKKFLKKLLRSDIKTYYCTPKLNESLYLHYNGFDAIENLE